MINMHSNQCTSSLCLSRQAQSRPATTYSCQLQLSEPQGSSARDTVSALLHACCWPVASVSMPAVRLWFARLQARTQAPHASCNSNFARKSNTAWRSLPHSGGKPQTAWQQLLFLQPCGCRKPAKSHESFPHVVCRDVAHTTAEDQGCFCAPDFTTTCSTALNGCPILDTCLSGNHRHLSELPNVHQALQTIFCQEAQGLNLPPRPQLKH